MKRNLIRLAFVISMIIITLNLSAYSQKCKPKRVIFPPNSETVTLKGNAKGCNSFLLKNTKNQRLQIKLTSPRDDMYFSMNQANATEEEMGGDHFCEDCKTLDYYFDYAETWKIWIDNDGSPTNKMLNYSLTFTLTDSPMIPSGVLNGKAISLPKPPFPKEAKEAGASGSVTVKVEVGEDGKVYYAELVSGNKLFYQAVNSAARAARFPLTLVNGKAVRISGTIVYNF